MKKNFKNPEQAWINASIAHKKKWAKIRGVWNWVCTACHTKKDKEQFSKDATKIYHEGRSKICKECRHKQYLKAKVTKRYRDRHRVYSKNFQKNNKEKVRAHALLKRAVQKGIVIKPTRCERCSGEFPIQKIQGHHEDYNKPLDVKWLCWLCHLKTHHERNNQ